MRGKALYYFDTSDFSGDHVLACYRNLSSLGASMLPKAQAKVLTAPSDTSPSDLAYEADPAASSSSSSAPASASGSSTRQRPRRQRRQRRGEEAQEEEEEEDEESKPWVWNR